jgi:CSLREA domain-containing protein
MRSRHSTIIPSMRSLSVYAALALAVTRSLPAAGAQLIVTTTADGSDALPGDGNCATAGGGCTLRAAVEEAAVAPGPTIVLVPPGQYVLTAGALDLGAQVSIVGGTSGAGCSGPTATRVDGGGLDRVVHVLAGATVELSCLTIANGRAANGAGIQNDGTLSLARAVVSGSTATGDGGGVYNAAGRPLDITDTTITANTAAGSGGGVFNRGTLTVQRTTIAANTSLGTRGGGGVFNEVCAAVTLTNTTVSGNRAAADGGGILNSVSIFCDSPGTTMSLRNVTLAANTADDDGDGVGDGGGLFGQVNPVTTLRNSLIAQNVDRGGQAPDCGGSSITSEGYNLIETSTGCSMATTTGDRLGTSALLGPLADNGGPTLTHALLAGSPAIDGANPDIRATTATACEALDQRGLSRPEPYPLGPCDVGAVEMTACGAALPKARVVAAVDDGTLGQPASVRVRDGGASFRVGPYEVWLFGDTILTPAAEDGATLRSNTAAIGTPGIDTFRPISEILDATGAPLQFVPFTPEEMAWNQTPGNPRIALWTQLGIETTPGAGVVFFQKVKLLGSAGVEILGIGTARVTTSSLASVGTVATRDPDLLPTDQYLPFMQYKGWVYLSGSVATPATCDGSARGMGRVRAKKLFQPEMYRYWNGHRWVADRAQAVAVPNFPPSVVYNKFLHRYLALGTDGLSYLVPPTFASMQTAKRITGPWSARAFAFPQIGNGSYFGQVHQSLQSRDGRELEASYFRNLPALTGEIRMERITIDRVRR